jgi:hypothetical protein
LPIQPQERARSVELIRGEILANGRKPLAQFFPIAPVPSVSETAEPTFNYAPVTPLCVS